MFVTHGNSNHSLQCHYHQLHQFYFRGLSCGLSDSGRFMINIEKHRYSGWEQLINPRQLNCVTRPNHSIEIKLEQTAYIWENHGCLKISASRALINGQEVTCEWRWEKGAGLLLQETGGVDGAGRNDEDEYLKSSWADPKQLLSSLQGLVRLGRLNYASNDL